VHLYFIVWVEVVEIQIWFVIYKTDLKKKKNWFADYDRILKPLYIVPHIVRIFGRKLRTRQTLNSHQIQVFRRRSEQLVGREARRELKEALAHVLGAEASSEAALTLDKHRPSRLTVAGLRCRSPPIKVSINTFPSSLWSRRSKPHQKLTTIAGENLNSGLPPCSAATRHRERKPAPPPDGANRRIGDERPRLELRYQLAWFNLSRRSGSQRLTFNEVRRPMSRRWWTRSTVPWIYSTDFS
jgi:hypothetical protein